MTRALVAFLAAFEAVITAAIGLGVGLAPLTLVWAVQYHMATSWAVFWRAAADAWLLGLGVDAHVDLDQLTAASLGLPGAVPSFTVTIAGLGVALFTVFMGARVGRRAAETSFVLTGAIAAVAAFMLTAWVVALTAQAEVFGPVIAQAPLVAGATFGAGVVLGIGLDWAAERDHVPPALARLFGVETRAAIAASLRAATAAVALLVAASAVLVALLLFTHFGKAVSLYEALQAGYLGGVTLTLAQLAFLPNAVLWAMSWLIGPGFALGGGAAIAPGSGLSTSLPGVPLFAIIPAHSPAIAFVAIVIPVLAGAVSGFLTHRTLTRSTPPFDTPVDLALVAVGSAVAGGLMLALLAWWSGGTLAPGALANLGPSAWKTGVFGGLELGVGMAFGLAAAHLRGQSLDWTSLRKPDSQVVEKAREVASERDFVTTHERP
ncbi:cell division protein PerM [Gryllotalpicola koreensis]|uniref:PTS sugar transporter subunit IIC n=1 Tax=Gryllotalpicola koreensis TaxID=993086 RepID=A0ABP8A422_9MICO